MTVGIVFSAGDFRRVFTHLCLQKGPGQRNFNAWIGVLVNRVRPDSRYESGTCWSGSTQLAPQTDIEQSLTAFTSQSALDGIGGRSAGCSTDDGWKLPLSRTKTGCRGQLHACGARTPTPPGAVERFTSRMTTRTMPMAPSGCSGSCWRERLSHINSSPRST